jgi:Concanavalin A-like lectin/glucanases superfamily
MLGASQAVQLGACATQQQVPAPISLWSFDETGGTSFADHGPANVPMDIVGTWADLSTASMVQGIGGTSAYTNGSGHATIPANDPDHDLSELTISFYYQRNSAAAKQILLAAGNGTQAGDFSIEVLANGRLRGYHVGQDLQLRFFESTNGITGTDLQVGTAHRIDLTLGSLGARIYLNGAPLIHAFILANTNGWNNTRIKYLGRWIDGALSPADGAFDRLRIWDRQLTSLQISILEPARSITLPGGETLELSVPSLAEWLLSDEATPAATKYVSNQNRGNGSGSSPANAQEIQAALNGASAGQTFVAVCQTPGTIEYWEKPNGLTIPSGSAGNPVTLQARQGDGVVISKDQEFAGARTPNSGFWTQSGLSQDDINKKIWRSSGTFTSGATVRLYGVWIEFGHPHLLLAYNNLTDLRATYGTADTPTNYGIPGVVLHTDGRLYIRMQKPHAGKVSVGNTWQNHLWPGHPEAISNGQIAYPVTENPNSYPIHLYRRSNTSAFNATSTNGHIKIGSGINSLGYQHIVAQCSNLTMRRGTHISWHTFMQVTATRSNIDLQRTRMSGGSKRHGSRDEWKFGGSFEPDRGAWVEVSGTDALVMTNWNLKDCTIADFHEIIVGQGSQWRFRNCTIFNILDDGVQGHCTTNQVEFGYCYFRNAAYGGHGQGGGIGGTYFFHHNILDPRVEKCAFYRQAAVPNFLWLNHSTGGSQPRKVYNNTLLWGPDVEEAQSNGLNHNDERNNASSEPHEVFNNIVIRHGTRRYPAIGFFSQPQTDFVQGRLKWGGSNEMWDYNLYYRQVPQINGAFLNGILQGASSGFGSPSLENFATLAAWRASSAFQTSKQRYAPGFEANGTDTKPTLPSLDNFPTDRFKYRPSPTAAVTTATTSSLSGANWWSTPPSWGASFFPWNDGEKTLAPSNWKGALDPNGSTLPVGVQNP